VGIGRSFTPALKGSSMTTPNPAAPVNPAPVASATAAMEATRAERYRVREIEATARQMNMPGDMLAAAIEDGTTLADFQRQALDFIGSDTGTATRQRMFAPAIRRGGEREYSLTRAGNHPRRGQVGLGLLCAPGRAGPCCHHDRHRPGADRHGANVFGFHRRPAA
jgi:hypothetical protein